MSHFLLLKKSYFLSTSSIELKRKEQVRRSGMWIVFLHYIFWDFRMYVEKSGSIVVTIKVYISFFCLAQNMVFSCYFYITHFRISLMNVKRAACFFLSITCFSKNEK